jgi:hypothetical protein
MSGGDKPRVQLLAQFEVRGGRDIDVGDAHVPGRGDLVDRVDNEVDRRHPSSSRGGMRHRAHILEERLLDVRVHGLPVQHCVRDQDRLSRAPDDHPGLAVQPEEAGDVTDVALDVVVGVHEERLELGLFEAALDLLGAALELLDREVELEPGLAVRIGVRNSGGNVDREPRHQASPLTIRFPPFPPRVKTLNL